MATAAAVSSSSSSTRIPIKLAPQLFHPNDNTSTYHTLQHASSGGMLELGGATLRASSGNNGSTSHTISLAAPDGTKLSGSMNTADERDYVLLYDDASRSYILHKVSSVSHLLPVASGTSAKATTPNSRSKTENSTGSTYSPPLARTPQSTNSPSLAPPSHKPLSKGRDSATAAYASPVIGATGSGTAKKRASQVKASGYDSSPTPSIHGGTSASYGLGISTAAGRPSPSVKSTSILNKGKAPVQDVEEFDMGNNSDDGLQANVLQLPPAQAPVGKAPAPSSDYQTSSGAQQYSGQKQPSHHHLAQAAKTTSTSLSNLLNQDVVMSEVSSEDEGDFDDLANDLESSLVGQGPFARAGLSTGLGGMDDNVISSDEDEDDDFVNALSEQSKPPVPPQIQQQPPQQVAQPVLRTQQDQPQPQRQVPALQQPPSRPVQAGKKLPTAPPRKYDSDIASSSESDDDSD